MECYECPGPEGILHIGEEDAQLVSHPSLDVTQGLLFMCGAQTRIYEPPKVKKKLI